VPSTIVDVTGDIPRVLRVGAIPTAKLRDVVPTVVGPAEEG
jgi:tRNA A37 threonylcarbamoyladenosine synthetase subunit TsaC/SUA5/YrdC